MVYVIETVSCHVSRSKRSPTGLWHLLQLWYLDSPVFLLFPLNVGQPFWLHKTSPLISFDSFLVPKNCCMHIYCLFTYNEGAGRVQGREGGVGDSLPFWKNSQLISYFFPNSKCFQI